MIQLDRVAKTYGDRELFRELSWQLAPGQRIGLVGPNGAGKTTLFRMLTGEVDPDAGRVVVPRDWQVGLLPQEVDSLEDRPLLDVVLSGRQDLMDLEARMTAIERDIEAARQAGRPADAIQPLIDEYATLQHEFEVMGGYPLRHRAREILGGMGFDPDDVKRSAAELSGGWRMRLLLSQLLLQRPAVLLMDEPTNHLDLPSLEWLETFLGTYEGTVVVVSHDRYFLNRLVNGIAAFETDGFVTFVGNYDRYVEERDARLDVLRQQKAQQDRKIKQTERFIERFRYKNTKARQVQSRVKALEKLERIELPDDRKRVRFHFPEGPRSGRVVAELNGASKRYGETIVYRSLDFQLLRGERLALVGPNGHGKTTLLKLMAGDERVDGGRCELGHQVAVGYFAQHQVDALDLSNTLLAEMEQAAPLETRPRCRSILGAFLFSGDDVDKRVAVLSGGEKSRLALAKLLLRPTNLLLLDEPTNHLDMVSRDVLLDALAAYQGTIVLVSHDRLFINALATRVVHVEGGAAINYPGDYEYYHDKRGRELAADARSGDDEPSANDDAKAGTRAARKEERRREAERRNEMHRRTKGLKQRLKKAEAEIAEREARLAAVETLLADPGLYDNPDRARALAHEHAEQKERVARLYDTWADLASRIEGIEGELADTA